VLPGKVKGVRTIIGNQRGEAPAGQILPVDLLVPAGPDVDQTQSGGIPIIAQRLDAEVVVTDKGPDRKTVFCLEHNVRRAGLFSGREGRLHLPKGGGIEPVDVIGQGLEVDVLPLPELHGGLDVRGVKVARSLADHPAQLAAQQQNLHHPVADLLLGQNCRDDREILVDEVGGKIPAKPIEIGQRGRSAEVGGGDGLGHRRFQPRHRADHATDAWATPGGDRFRLGYQHHPLQPRRYFHLLPGRGLRNLGPGPGSRGKGCGSQALGAIILKRLTIRKRWPHPRVSSFVKARGKVRTTGHCSGGGAALGSGGGGSGCGGLGRYRDGWFRQGGGCALGRGRHRKPPWDNRSIGLSAGFIKSHPGTFLLSGLFLLFFDLTQPQQNFRAVRILFDHPWITILALLGKSGREDKKIHRKPKDYTPAVVRMPGHCPISHCIL